ncbi:response regulator [Streptomyces sp. NPDC056492]|uniref:response regulator n=1 Tax=unclassified Streptomyces TaxID=2593676 RepID=UPI0036BF143C
MPREADGPQLLPDPSPTTGPPPCPQPTRPRVDAGSETIRVLLTHDEPLVLLGLRALLEAATGIEVVAETADPSQTLTLARTTAADLVLTGLPVPDSHALAIVRRLRALPLRPAVVVLTTTNSHDAVTEALGAGAGGYLLKDTRAEQLVHAVHTVAQGGTVLAPACAARLVEAARAGTASTRILPEQRHLLDTLPAPLREVLGHLAVGQSNAEIARRLYLTEGSVKNYVSRLLAALRLDNRTQAAVLAHQAGILLSGHDRPRA